MMCPRALTLYVLLLGGFVLSCSNSAGTNVRDVTLVADMGVANDLASDLSEAAIDASPEESLDAGVDRPSDRGADAPVDRPDASLPPADAWADVPRVDLGGFLIPVDPNAVPAPGSECISDASVRMGDPAIAPPRPVRPLSVSRVTSQRPTFQWVLPAGTTGARVEVCADRCCTRVLQTIDAEGTTVRPMTALPPGVVFWRMFGRRGTAVGLRPSYTWEFGVRRRDAPNDTSWGTIRDFNGDGFDDVLVITVQTLSAPRSDVLLVPGSAGGLLEPRRNGLASESLPQVGSVGDFNGDGIADAVWDDYSSVIVGSTWLDVVNGSRDGLRLARRPDAAGIGHCARIRGAESVDWNGDGYSDVIASIRLGCALLRPPDASILVGYLGSSIGIADIPQWAARLDGRFGFPFTEIVARHDDIDLDGYGDIHIVSGHSGGGTTSMPEEHYIAHGNASQGPDRYERCGESLLAGASRVTTIGDVDGDGHTDFSILFQRPGSVSVFQYGMGLDRPSAILRDVAPFPGSGFGEPVSAGDVNADGLADVIVSASASTDVLDGDEPVDVGRVYVYLSVASRPESPVWIQRERVPGSPVRRSGFGGTMIGQGDVDGDGIDDIVMTDSLNNDMCLRRGRSDFTSGFPDVCMVRPWPFHALYL